MADTGVPQVKRVKLYLNGDQNFSGKIIVVNPRYYRNFESFLDTATWSTHSTSAVTRICTPQGRHTIDSVDKLSNGANYVAVGRERFKKLKYGETKLKKVAAKLPSIWRSQLPSSGRFRKVYEGEKQALKRIYVYRNGDNKTPARMILLKKRNLTDMELVLAALQESNINCDFAISKLFTLNGKQVCSCDEITHDGKYVALERGSRFKPINYEGIASLYPRNVVTQWTRLPTIPTARSNQSTVSYSPRKKPHFISNKLATTKQTKTKQTEKKSEKIVVSTSLPKQESILSSFDDDKRESFSHVSLSVTPPPLDESPDFTLSEDIMKMKERKKEIVEENATSKVAIPNDLNELPEQQKESIGLKLYNASGMQSEWGDMVVDNKDTVTDKLIDNIPAEEIVDEDISENVEDIEENTTMTEKLIEAVKDNVIDNNSIEETVVEDVAENTKDSTERIKTSDSGSSENTDNEKDEQKETGNRESVEEGIVINNEQNDDEGKEKSRKEVVNDYEDKSEVEKEIRNSPKVPVEVEITDQTSTQDKSKEEEENEENRNSPEALVEEVTSDDQKSTQDKSEEENEENRNSPEAPVEEVITDDQISTQDKSKEEENEEIRNSPEAPVEEVTSDDQRSKSEEPEPEEKEDEESGDEDENVKQADKQELQDAESPPESRCSTATSQDMNSEDEVRSEEEEEEDNDDDEKDDDDGNNSNDEDDESENDATEEKNETDSDDDAASDIESSSENDSDADEPATKENKTNKKVEEQRADLEAAKKIDMKQNNRKMKRKENRIDNKA